MYFGFFLIGVCIVWLKGILDYGVFFFVGLENVVIFSFCLGFSLLLNKWK